MIPSWLQVLSLLFLLLGLARMLASCRALGQRLDCQP